MSIPKFLLLCFAVLILPTNHSWGDEKPVVLKVGDKAPVFSGTDENNKPWDSKSRSGKKVVVVYFYPADMTPGCTKQACNYRDALSELKREDVEIVGVSGDTPENHKHFKNEFQLNFTLLADPEGKIADAFGVKTTAGGSIDRMIQGKKVTLQRGVTAMRWTFVIDKQGKIAHKDTSVNFMKDAETVLKVIEKL
ncbi:MAG: peroxiredoxin [Planctomycetes bacterium]|nr:peroxiredoxin [Planctomycetota bacterium]